MASVLERDLITITGKGGVGKTTVAGALGLLGARRGLRTIVVEVGDQHRLPLLFGVSTAETAGVEVKLGERLWSLSIDPDRVLVEWLRKLGGRISARVLTSSSTFQYFVAAAPGAREILSMVKVAQLAQDGGGPDTGYDLTILDAPATGHALALLRSPRTFASIARVGPIAGQADAVRDLLEDSRRSSYLAVTHASEMAISETMDLQAGLRRELDRELHTVIVNGVLPRRFDREELRQIAQARTEHALARAASVAAHAVHERAARQQTHIARLRSQTAGASRSASPDARARPAADTHHSEAPSLLSLPFVFEAELGVEALGKLADKLARKL
jgi:anion-transporting  ArsA/GET3 family ATPase